MNKVIELISSFPTVIWTAVLAFCLAWWLVSLVVSGIDGSGEVDVDGDGDLDLDGDLDGDGDVDGTDRFLGSVAKMLHVGQVPLSLGLTVLSFGAFTVSGLLQLAVGGVSSGKAWPGGALFAVSAVVFMVASVFGLGLLWYFAKLTAPLFVTEKAPERIAALGGTCRIRTTHVSNSLGEAEVISGSAKGQIVRVRTDDGDFALGDLAQLIGYDAESAAFTIVELDPVLRPG
jgi:hypothetical protein